MFAQQTKPALAYPTHLPCAFSNFVWWTDADLRSQLKARIPGLGDKIGPDRASESKIRDTLKALLKQKGIVADVMSEEPSPWSLTAETVPGAPGPAIVFSILNPQILVDQITIAGAPKTESDAIDQSLHGRKHGYADAVVEGPPIVDHEHALVSYHLSVTSGPLYHLRSLTIHSLDPGQESKVRRLLGIGPGDLFDELAVSSLYDEVRADSSLNACTFSFSPVKDKSAEMVDLTLDFSRNANQPTVTVP